MFYKESNIIKPHTFKLIQLLQTKEYIKDFYLVGGTSLALQIGHQFSIDIDLFTQQEFDSDQLFSTLQNDFAAEVFVKNKNTLLCFIENVKTDFIKHSYPFINPPICKDGIAILSCEDIAAMKVNAIINSGQRFKDFIDIYYLLELFSIKDILQFFNQKYKGMNAIIAPRALTFFDEIDYTNEPPITLKKLTAKQVQKRILDAMAKPTKIFN